MHGELRAILFDVFGTVVDWRTGVTRALAAFGQRHDLAADWAALADDWRSRYQPSLEQVRRGERDWTILDVLHRETLIQVLADNRIPQPDDAALDALTLAWHRLDPWPDAVAGLVRLRTRFVIGTLSNGNTTLLADMAARAGLPWDVRLGAETAGAYKPLPEAYLRNVALLDLAPAQVMLVAAHNSDLHAAAGVGMRTGFVARPREHGPAQTCDLAPTGPWDVVAADFGDLADRLGCSG